MEMSIVKVRIFLPMNCLQVNKSKIKFTLNIVINEINEKKDKTNKYK